MIADGEEIPLPPEPAEPGVVALPLLSGLKVRLYLALREAGITWVELARRLAWKCESVDRLFRLDHASRLEQVEQAFAALGRRVAFRLREAA